MSILSGFRKSRSLTVGEVEQILEGQLGAVRVSLHDPESPNPSGEARKLRRDKPIRKATCKPVELRALFQPEDEVVREEEAEGGPEAEDTEPDEAEGSRAVGADGGVDARLVRFVREVDRLERARKFVWIGYVVKERLPELGFGQAEAQEVLDRAQREGMVSLQKIPNPKNPDFPTTTIVLNRDHPVVRKVLHEGDVEERRELIRVRGAGLSETILAERR